MTSVKYRKTVGDRYLKYKVVQIWPGQTVTCLHTNRPGHIWTTLYKALALLSGRCFAQRRLCINLLVAAYESPKWKLSCRSKPSACLNVPLYSRHCDSGLVVRPYGSVLYLSLGISSGRGCRTTGCFEMLKVVIVKSLEGVRFCVFYYSMLKDWAVWAADHPSSHFLFEIIFKILTEF